MVKKLSFVLFALSFIGLILLAQAEGPEFYGWPSLLGHELRINDPAASAPANDSGFAFGNLTLNGAGQAQAIYGSSTTAPLYFDSNINDGAAAVGHIFDTEQALSTSGAKLLSIRNNAAEGFFVNDDFMLSQTATLDDATGNEIAYALNYTVNKLTSGNDTGLLISMTDSASPGTSLPLDIQVGGASKFYVNSAGAIVASSYVQGTSFYPTSGLVSPSAINTNMICQNSNYNVAGTALNLSTGSATMAAGQFNAVAITPTIVGSGTAAATDLLINRTETSVGSGAQLLLDAQVGGASRFSVSNEGIVAINGGSIAGGATSIELIQGDLTISSGTQSAYITLGTQNMEFTGASIASGTFAAGTAPIAHTANIIWNSTGTATDIEGLAGGINISPVLNGTIAQAIGSAGYIIHGGTGIITTAVASTATIDYTSTGTTTNSVGLHVEFTEWAAHTQTNQRGINIEPITLGSTLNVGLDIANVSGATSNFAIRTGTGTVSFGDNLQVAGKSGNTNAALTLGAGVTTFASTSNVMTLTGNAGANTIATITGGLSGQLLTLIFVDALITITDDNTHAANSVDLGSAFTSADDSALQLVYDGTSFYEVSRSAN